MDQQCESFSRIFSSAIGLDKSFMFIRNTRTSSSINENFEILFWHARFIQKLVNEAARCVFYYLTCVIHYDGFVGFKCVLELQQTTTIFALILWEEQRLNRF
jgi:hypothetical protein